MTAMSSDDALVARAGGDAALWLYDYLKHLTTLALVALGGVLGIAGDQIARDALAIAAGTIGLGGGLALTGMLTVVRDQAAGRPLPRSARWLRTLSGAAFSFGVGTFLVVFLRAL